MRIYAIGNDGASHQYDGLEGLSMADCKLVWVDVVDPSPEERSRLRDFFGLHPLLVEVKLDAETVPRVQEFNGHLFVVWNMLRGKPGTDKTGKTDKMEGVSLYMVMGDDFLITAHVEDVPEVDAMFRRLQGEGMPRRQHPAYFLYTIMNISVEEWFPLVEALKDDIDTYMEDMLADTKSGDVGTVMALKHRNMASRRIISALRDVVMRLARRDLEVIPDELSVYLMDVYDRLTRLYLEVDNNSDLISSSLDIHLSMVSNRLNVTMKRLTAIATFFMPATFLAGVYGTNFVHVPEYKWYFGYLFFWIAIVVITVIMFAIGRKQDWL